MYECTPSILKHFNDEPGISPSNSMAIEEVEAALTHISVRLRSMARLGHSDAVWRLQDLPWSIDYIKPAVELLAGISGLSIYLDHQDQTIKAFWGPKSI